MTQSSKDGTEIQCRIKKLIEKYENHTFQSCLKMLKATGKAEKCGFHA